MSVNASPNIRSSIRATSIVVSSEKKFLFHLNEAFLTKRKFGISRKNLKKIGYHQLAKMPGKGDILYFDFCHPKSTQYHFQKRVVDLVASTFAISLFLPLALFISITVLLDIGWPLLFFQYRLNHKGQKIMFIKFRSMRSGSDKDDERTKAMRNFITGTTNPGGNKKIINEALVSRSGKFLRKYSLDELPQILCVLTGTMSLVGPRPCLQDEFESYKDWHKLRLLSKPGCTGMWQVFGRSIVSFDESVLMDIYYSTQQDILLDLKLMLKTIPVMILGKGGL